MLTNQYISEQLAQITNAKRITIYVGMNEFHALVMNGLNQSMKFEGHDVVNVRLQSYFRIEVEYDNALINGFIRDVTYMDKGVAYIGYREDTPISDCYIELVKKVWED